MTRSTSLLPSASIDAVLDIPEGKCALSYTPINVDEVINSVRDDGAGATAVFIGTTRNSFRGKTVTHLEYEAYSKLALKTIVGIVHKAAASISRSDHHSSNDTPVSSLIRCAVHHRLGTVSVGEPSIVIAVSSPHRKEAFVACGQILEEVKRKAQIWKREYYEGEDESTAEWKANS